VLQISTNKLSQRKHVEIDGHYYIVRRIGAGDQLTFSQYMRELEVLDKKEKSGNKLTESEIKRVTEIEAAALDISAGCFDDQGDGSKSKELVRNLSSDELAEIMRQVFDEQPEVS
jgi:hypothetical protein